MNYLIFIFPLFFAIVPATVRWPAMPNTRGWHTRMPSTIRTRAARTRVETCYRKCRRILMLPNDYLEGVMSVRMWKIARVPTNTVHQNAMLAQIQNGYKYSVYKEEGEESNKMIRQAKCYKMCQKYQTKGGVAYFQRKINSLRADKAAIFDRLMNSVKLRRKSKFVLLVCAASIMTVKADAVTELWNQYPENGKYVVPYQFTSTYSPEERSTILTAMQKIAANTCVQFRERTNEEQYVEIKNNESSGCGANVGRVSGKTTVNLESSCMDAKTVMIMLLHGVGLSGEHQREDRDDYVKMHFENVRDPKVDAFLAIAKSTQKYLSIPYDYLSIMHKAKDAHAKPGTITIETVDPAYQDKIGKQSQPSARDYEKVNVLYKCNKT